MVSLYIFPSTPHSHASDSYSSAKMATDVPFSLANLVSIEVQVDKVPNSTKKSGLLSKWKWSYTIINSDQLEQRPYLNGQRWDLLSRKYHNNHNIDFAPFIRQLGLWNITTNIFAGDDADATNPKSTILVSGLFRSIIVKKGCPKPPTELRLFLKSFHHVWIPSSEVSEFFEGSIDKMMAFARQFKDIWAMFSEPFTLYHGSINPDYQPIVFRTRLAVKTEQVEIREVWEIDPDPEV